MNHSVLVKKPVGDVLSPAANAAVQASKYAGRATGLLPVDMPDEPHAATDLKLLEAAGEVFADKGYRAATIREIIRRAQVNIAAVNYHYGDKQNLYAAVFRYARKCCEERFPLPGLPNSQSKHANSKVPPRDQLHFYVLTFLNRILDHGRPAWHWQLMAREMMEPTVALDEMVAGSIRPEFEALRQIMQQITGLALNDGQLELCCCSLVGQVLFYRHAHAVIARLNPEATHDEGRIEKLAKHITEFTLMALDGVGKNARFDKEKQKLKPADKKKTRGARA